MDGKSRQRVGLVPITIFQHEDCGCEEQAIYAFMSTHACRSGFLWLGLATIAAAVKLDRGKVRRRVEKLAALGLVERLPHPDPAIRCWMYRLTGHANLIDGLLGEEGDELTGLSRNPAPERVSATVERCDEHEHLEHPTEESLSGAISRVPGESDREIGMEHERNEPAVPETPVPLSPAWAPSKGDLAFAGTARSDLTPSDIAAVAEKFVRHYGGQHLPDPSSIFRSWIRKEIKPNVHSARQRSTGFSTGGTVRSSTARINEPGRLAERNRAAADDCLRRILARRTEHLSS